MAPFNVSGLSTVSSMLVFGAIGFGFGAALELAGFGDTRKLAAQFYLREMTVLKVMFTAIVVAAVLIAGAASFGWLDMSRVWVNPTFLWSELAGGLIMGLGFVVGGFCPGTSLVAAATFKIDGILFVLGGLVGVWLFGESVGSYEPFWNSGNLGRFTIQDWLGVSTGVVILGVVAFGLLSFWAAEAIERRFGAGRLADAAAAPAKGGMRLAGAALLGAAAVVLAVRGEPSAEQRWAWAGHPVHQLLASRGAFASPAEVVALRKDTALRVQLLDLRDEHDFNLFHVGGARRVEPAELRGAELRQLLDAPASTITFLVGDGEARSTEAWRWLAAQGVKNVYVVEGGVTRWLDLYPAPACVAQKGAGTDGAWSFTYAAGEALPSSWPELERSRSFRFPCATASVEEGEGEYRWPDYAFTKKVKPQMKAVVKGGCG